jgi:folate-dependent phosphoribosylglycinamide formyltransferase PurN
MPKVALLGSIGVPTVGHFAASLESAGLPFQVVLNSKVETQAALAVWAERTGGAIPPIVVSEGRSIFVDRFSTNEAARILAGYDVALNGGTLEILKGQALSAPRLGIVNIHPGLLPKYRGCTCVEWALYNGDPVGLTAHLMDAGIDTGPILGTREIDISGLKYQEIRVKVYQESFRFAAEIVSKLLRNEIERRTQSGGQYWPVIPADHMAEILRRLK